jgi:hypothetical protein
MVAGVVTRLVKASPCQNATSLQVINLVQIAEEQSAIGRTTATACQALAENAKENATGWANVQ